MQSPGPHSSTPGKCRNNHSPSFGKEQLSSMQILPNDVKGLGASDTWLQLLTESRQGEIKESWSVGQHQPENKPQESQRSTTALGDTPGQPGGAANPCLRVMVTERKLWNGMEQPCTHFPQLCAPLFPHPHLHLHEDAHAQPN